MKPEDRKLAGLVRQTLAPVSEPLPSVDLWSRFERRLYERPTRIGRVDWAMAALVLVLLIRFPKAVLLLLCSL